MIPYWILRIIRTITFFGLHALFIPITTTLISPFYCPTRSVWPFSNHHFTCYDSGHLGFFIASIVLLPCWIVWNLVISAFVINRVPDITGKRNILCAAHGRVFAAVILVKTILSGIYIFAPILNTWVYCIIVLLSGIIYTGLYWQYLPYFHNWINQFQLAIGAVFTVAGVSLLVAEIIDDPTNSAGVAGFLLLSLPAMYIGYSLGSLRFRSFSHKGELFSPFAVELRARFLLFELIDQIGNANDAVVALAKASGEGLYAETKTTDMIKEKNSITSTNNNSTAGFSSLSATSNSNNNNNSSSNHNNKDKEKDKDNSNDTIDEEMALLRKNDIALIVNSQLTQIDALYKEASNIFSSSSILQLFYAQFWGVYRFNERLERIYLAFAESCADQLSFDIRFFVRKRRMDIRMVASDTADQSMTIERRMQYERLQELSRAQVIDLRNLVLNFWAELSNKNPDLHRTQQVGLSINRVMADCHETFKELLFLAPQSTLVMRAYADFLLELSNDPKKALELLNDAEQLEDERSKNHGVLSSADLTFGNIIQEFDLTSETLAWCKVSSNITKLGTITDVNQSLLKLFGYNRRDMIGRDVAIFVPEPIASIHTKLIQRYLSTGKERMVNQYRLLLALHRNGYIFPIKFNIRPTAEEFIAVFEEVPSNLAFMFFLGAEHDWKVTAACKTSLSAFQFTVAQMKNGSVSLNQFGDDIPRILNTLVGITDSVEITLADIRVRARLQIFPIAFLNSPMYILRYRIVGYLNNSVANPLLTTKTMAIKNTDVPEMDSSSVDANEESSGGEEDADVDPMPSGSISTYGNRNGISRSIASSSKLIIKVPDTVQKQKSPVINHNQPSSSTVKKAIPPPMVVGHPDIDLDADISLCPVMGGGSKKNSIVGDLDHDLSSSPLSPSNIAASVSTHSKENTDDSDSKSVDSSQEHSTTSNMKLSASSNRKFLDPSNMSIDRSINTRESDEKESSTNLAASNHGSSVPSTPSIPNTPIARSNLVHEGMTQHNSGLLRVNFTGEKDKNTNNFAPFTDVPRPTPKAKAEIPVGITPRAMNKLPDDQLSAREGSVLKEGSIVYHGQNGARSVKHGGTIVSKESGASTSSITDLLRKGVARSSARLERSLKLLKRSIIIVFLAIATLNLISIIITSVLFGQLKKNLLLVGMNGDRALYMNRAIGYVQSLILSAENKFVIPESPSYIRGKVQGWVDNLEDLHRQLYVSVDGSIPEEVLLYTKPLVRMDDLVLESYVNRTTWETSYRQVGLANGVLELISKLRLVQALDYQNVTLDKTEVWFVMHNGMAELQKAINRSVMLADDRTSTHVANIELTNLIVTIIAEVVLFLIILFVMMPAVNSVAKTKQKIFNTFLDVPVNIIRALRNRVQKKVEAVIRSENDEDHAMDIDNNVDETEAGTNLDFIGLEKDKIQQYNNNHHQNGLLHSPRPPMISGNGSVASSDNGLGRALQANQLVIPINSGDHSDDDDDDTYSKRNIFCGCCDHGHHHSSTKNSVSPTLPGGRKRRQRSFRNTRSTQIMVLLSMILPVICYSIYFAAVYQWRYSASREARNMKAEILWSKQAQVYTGLTNMYLRDAVAYCDPTFMQYSLNMTASSRNNLEYLQNALMYGADEMALRPGIQLSPEVYNLALVNGCVSNNDDAYNISTCQTSFYHGIFGNGFMQGCREFLHLTKQVIESTRTLIANDPSLSSCNPSLLLNSKIINDIDQMRWRYIQAGLTEFTRLRLDMSNTILDNFLVANIIVTISTIVALQIFYTTLYKPMIRTMDKEIKNVRLLLLLFPDEVSKQVPAIIAAGKEILSDTASVASGASG